MNNTDQRDLSLPIPINKVKQAIVKKKPVVKKTRRKGKKSIPFDKDPEILARLAKVAELMLVGAKAFQIAATMNCSLGTAKRDIGRVKQLWKDDARIEIDGFRSAALALYKLVIMRAWEQFGKNENATKRDCYLTLVVATQKEIDRIQGVGPLKVDLSGKLDITEDIENIRKRRWNTIKPQIAEMLKQMEPTKSLM